MSLDVTLYCVQVTLREESFYISECLIVGSFCKGTLMGGIFCGRMPASVSRCHCCSTLSPWSLHCCSSRYISESKQNYIFACVCVLVLFVYITELCSIFGAAFEKKILNMLFCMESV